MKKFRVPHTLVLLYGMIVFAYVLTWLVPAGAYETTSNDHGRDVVIPGTYSQLEGVDPLPVWNLFLVIPRGLQEAQGIIFFIFIIGGALAVIRSTGVVDAVLSTLLNRFGNRPAWLILTSMLLISAASSTIGMAEEFIPFTAVLIMLCAGMKLDAIVAVGMLVVGYGIGYGVASINPFTVLVAQEVAGLELISGLAFRLALFVPFFLIGFSYVWRYARKIRSTPGASLMAGVDTSPALEPDLELQLSSRHGVVLALAGITLVAFVWGITQKGWYLVELGALFMGLAIAVGFIAGESLDDMARTFTAGAAELTGTALLIGFARAIELTLSDGQILHTIVHGLGTPLSQAGSTFAAAGMLFIQSILNFFIPSGSGQAYATMPIMAPISDVVGLSRQVAVLAYQMGDGFMNTIVPTNAVLMGILGIAQIPFDRWFRFIAPLVVQLVLAGCIALAVAVAIGYQ